MFDELLFEYGLPFRYRLTLGPNALAQVSQVKYCFMFHIF
jgi:hypothetical protein